MKIFSFVARAIGTLLLARRALLLFAILLNCPATLAQMSIAEGTYEGSFEGGLTSQFSLSGVSFDRNLQIQGKFTLSVSRDDAMGSTLNGSMRITYRMTGGAGDYLFTMPYDSQNAIMLKSMGRDNFAAAAEWF